MAIDPEALRAQLHELGFDVVRFAAAGPAPRAGAIEAWLKNGYQADMAWMERTLDKRSDPRLVLSGARSVILLGVNYGRRNEPETTGERRPVWARYALHLDYHDTIKPALAAAGRILEQHGLGPEDYRYYVDTGPLVERGWAARAGIGFIGKNGMVISREFGNWLFLSAILVRVDLPADPPVTPRADENPEPGLLCGKCTRCLDACPTNAFPEPGVVDARRCVSYQTIENKGIIPRELRVGIGARIYGCDTCLEVCPWNRFARDARALLLEARPAIADLSLREILELTPERFAERFRGTAMKRLKLRGLLRNACIVAANTRATECIDVLVDLARHPEPMVRAHAVWAVRVLGAGPLLSAARAAESDPRVLDEYAGELENAPAPHKAGELIAAVMPEAAERTNPV